MPIYEYFCPKCKSRFELLRALESAGEEVACPVCHTSSRRVFSTCASFSKNEDGTSSPIAGSGSSCSTCSGGVCPFCR